MPASLTHDYFGNDVLLNMPKALASSFDWSNKDIQNTFLLGCQGPDPFFYAQLSCSFMTTKKFGSLMHKKKPKETLAAFRRIANDFQRIDQELITSYILGFLCHYALDSTTHPFIYAWQNAICNAGVNDLDRRDGFDVHVFIEAELDMMMHFQRHGCTLRMRDIRNDILNANDATLFLLNRVYQQLAFEVYDYDLARDAFSRGVKDMRTTLNFLYSPRGIKRSLFGMVEGVFRRHSSLMAMSPRNDVLSVSAFDNREHAEWIYPATGVASSKSFAELYVQAIDKVILDIDTFMSGGSLQAIIRGLNFDGDLLNLE